MTQFLTSVEAERHARNVRSSNDLLMALRKYHGGPQDGDSSLPKEKSVADVDGTDTSRSPQNDEVSDDALREWCRRQMAAHKTCWFHIVDEITPSGPPAISRIISEICRHYNVRKSEIISSRRSAGVVFPRHVAMYLAKTLTLRSLPEIGRRFGGRDHTTVLYAVRKIEVLIAKDTALATDIEIIKARIGGSYGTQADARPLPRNEARHGPATSAQQAPDRVAEPTA